MRISLPSGASLRENVGLRILSLLLAFAAWMLAQGEQTYHATVVVPVEYQFPEELILAGDTPPPDQVVIQTSGSRAAMKTLQEEVRDIEIIYEVDLRYAEPGRTVHSFRQPPDSLPDQVTIHTVSPSEVELMLDVLVTRTLPVELKTRGELPEGYAETARSTQPAQVTLRGGQTRLKEVDAVATEALRLNKRTENFEGEIALDLSDLHIHPDSPRSVRATVVVQEVVGQRTLSMLRVGGSDEATGLVVQPVDCSVTLEGPLPVLLDLGPGAVSVQLHASESALNQLSRTATLPWMVKGGAEEGLYVEIGIEHPRGADVMVSSVEPSTFQLTRPATGKRSDQAASPDTAPAKPSQTDEAAPGSETTGGNEQATATPDSPAAEPPVPPSQDDPPATTATPATTGD